MSKSKLDPQYRKDLVEVAHNCLLESSDGKRGRVYLKNKRGISSEVAKEWQIGYCPKGVGDLTFNDRVIVPYYDKNGELLSVSARKVQGEKPVWWNEVFDKKKHLFGLHKAKYNIIRKGYVIIVEGQFDVISLHSHGINNAVAICSSSMSEYHISALSRYTDRFVLAFDRDKNQSGQMALDKAWNFLERRSLKRYVWPLGYEEETDPDEYVRRHGGEYCLKELNTIVHKWDRKNNPSSVLDYFVNEIMGE